MRSTFSHDRFTVPTAIFKNNRILELTFGIRYRIFFSSSPKQDKAMYTFAPIGHIHSCFKEKFGIPRQPGLVPEAHGTLEIFPPYQRIEAFRELENFSHIWIIFIFHQCRQKNWRPTVRPPRLGGNRRVGVFASRSGFRPNPIGQSVVELLNIENRRDGLWLHLKGIDLLDGTPVLDIKPYLPYADQVSDARSAYAQTPPSSLSVEFSAAADQACRRLEGPSYPQLRRLIVNIIAQDPRPAYVENHQSKTFGIRLWDLNIRFQAEERTMQVISITSIH
jgi:tRNA-Thr(GGU) m(6)t(6)A37 methyltransferase TsaA